jgi:hypothetical protein
MIIKDFEKSDYITLNNGKNWLGRPLGWKSVSFLTSMICSVFSFFYFVVPMKRSHQTMYEEGGMEAMLFPVLIVFLIFIFIFSQMINTNRDYLLEKKMYLLPHFYLSTRIN